MGINIKQIPNGAWKENCYIVNNNRGEGLIIDPGSEEKGIIGFIEEHQLNIKAILNTHAHYDHIGAVKHIKDKYNVPFFLHSKDEKLLKSANLYAKLFEGDRIIKIPTVDYFIDEIDIHEYLSVLPIKVIFTPGHTWGSVCLVIEDCLFTGDTLLNGKIGRVDLPGGDKQALKESLKTLSRFPGHSSIYPGHGPISTIAEQLLYNKEFSLALQ